MDPEIIDLTADDDTVEDSSVVIRHVLRAAIARVATNRVPTMFLSGEAAQAPDAPTVRFTADILPRLGLCGGTRFWARSTYIIREAIDTPDVDLDVDRDELLDDEYYAEVALHEVREYHVMALTDVDDGVKDVLRLGNAELLSDAVVRGECNGSMETLFYTKSIRTAADMARAKDVSPKAGDDVFWTDEAGVTWTRHIWRVNNGAVQKLYQSEQEFMRHLFAFL